MNQCLNDDCENLVFWVDTIYGAPIQSALCEKCDENRAGMDE